MNVVFCSLRIRFQFGRHWLCRCKFAGQLDESTDRASGARFLIVTKDVDRIAQPRRMARRMSRSVVFFFITSRLS